jgi:glycosyltransferase involved in cell wall biosynthesis
MKKRGHQVELWYPQAGFFRLPSPVLLKKWLGYIDQYIVFPKQVRRRLKKCSPDTLFVFTDHALGPWVPLVSDRPHIIHCHDFLAQRSALGKFIENPVSWTGRQYQAFIRKGYMKGKNFISVSEKTKHDLHYFLKTIPAYSEVVYNGLNRPFVPGDSEKIRNILSDKTKIDLSDGYLLHVGGNQWYKNRPGVIRIYEAWRSLSNKKLPLLLIGEPPSQNLMKTYNQSHYQQDIHFLSNVDDKDIPAFYAGTSVFLFPSIAEGFGWPIAEAMACGCPLITTNEAPMIEVAGNAGFLISAMPSGNVEIKDWAFEAGKLVENILTLSEADRKQIFEEGIENSKRFDTEKILDQIEATYKNMIQEKTKKEKFSFYKQQAVSNEIVDQQTKRIVI